jgi:hypothetical protein
MLPDVGNLFCNEYVEHIFNKDDAVVDLHWAVWAEEAAIC